MNLPDIPAFLKRPNPEKATMTVTPPAAPKAASSAGVRDISQHEIAANDLYSAASCGLSTLVGLNVPEGGRMQFIRGVLKKHETYGLEKMLASAAPLPASDGER